MAALNISHHQNASLDLSGLSNGQFNFNPGLDSKTRKLLVVGGVVLAGVFIVMKFKYRKK